MARRAGTTVATTADTISTTQTTISVIYDPNGPALRFEPLGVQFEVAVQVSLPEAEGADDELALRCYSANLQSCVEAPSAIGGRLHPWVVNAAAEFGEIAAPDESYPNIGTFGVPAVLTL